MDWLKGKKTYLVVACMIAYQVLDWYLHGTPPEPMRIMEAAGLATLRAGISKVRTPEAP